MPSLVRSPLSFSLLLLAAAGCGSTSADPVAADPYLSLGAADTRGIELYCATATACGVGYGGYYGAGLAECVFTLKTEAMQRSPSSQGSADRRALARCAAATPGDCNAIAACVAGPVVTDPRCAPNPGYGYAPPFCDGDRLYTCGGGADAGAGAARVTDCAARFPVDPSVGGDRCIGPGDAGASYTVARCGVGTCDPNAPGWTCKGSVLVRCDSGVLTAEDCAAEGLACPGASSYVAQCVPPGGTTSCTSPVVMCEGARAVSACSDGTRVPFADCGAREGWGCVASDAGYVPVSQVCQPTAGSCTDGDPGTCTYGVITYCADGQPRTFDCRSAGFSGCNYGQAGCAP